MASMMRATKYETQEDIDKVVRKEKELLRIATEAAANQDSLNELDENDDFDNIMKDDGKKKRSKSTDKKKELPEKKSPGKRVKSASPDRKENPRNPISSSF